MNAYTHEIREIPPVDSVTRRRLVGLKLKILGCTLSYRAAAKCSSFDSQGAKVTIEYLNLHAIPN